MGAISRKKSILNTILSLLTKLFRLRSGLNFTNVPVTIALEEKMDDWEDSISPMLNHYIAKFVAAYDTDYVIKVAELFHVDITQPLY